MLRAIPAAVYACDKDGYLLLYNEAAARLWGRRPTIGEERWCGSWKLFDRKGASLALEDCPIAMLMTTGATPEEVEIIAERPDGSRVTVLAHPTLIFNASGEIVAALNILVDITERREKEAAIERYTRELESRNHELMRFNRAAVSRELRMIDLKQEVNQLRSRLGLAPRYGTDFGLKST